MKYAWIILTGLWIAAAPAHAEPTVSVSAHLTPGDASLFEHQVTDLTLTVEARNIQLGRRLELRELPQTGQLKFGAFRELASERTQQGGDQVEVKRFRSEMTAMEVGTVRIAPQLSCSVVQSIPGGFGVMYREQQATVPVQPVIITIRPLPQDGRPRDFSGAVGRFILTATLEPALVAPGDLIKATMVLSGSGWTNGIQAPVFSLPEHFRVYDPKPMTPQPGELMRWEQTIVPQTTNATSVPAIVFNYFDDAAARYTRSAAGPFRLTFRDAISGHVTPFAATGSVLAVAATTNATASFVQQPPNHLARLSSIPGFWFAAASSAAFWLTVAVLVFRLASSRRRGIALGAALLLTALTIYLLALSAYRQGMGKERDLLIIRHGTQARFAPHQQAAATFSLPAGATVEIAETHGEWTRIRFNDNSGWIPSSSARK